MRHLTRQTIKALKSSKKDVHDLLDELQPYDIAKLYKDLPYKHHVKFLMVLAPQQIADLLQELEPEHQQKILAELGVQESGPVMDLMANDDLAALLEELSPDRIAELLANMKTEEAEIVQDIMNYPDETAGRLMSNRFIWVNKNYTIREAVEKVKQYAEFTETITYIYVVDEMKRLVGVVSHRDLILSDEKDLVEEIMYSRVVSVEVDTDQEEVATLIARYDFVSLPVVEDGVLVGIVTVDDMLDVVIQEATEDIEKLSASGKAIDFDTKVAVAVSRRLPWLMVLLFVGLGSGYIIGHFEETLDQVVALAFFTPMIGGMTGNIGTQSLVIVVRGLVTQELTKKVAFNLLWREFRSGILLGLACGILIAIVISFWQGIALGMVIGGSLVLTLTIGTLSGTIIPLILFRMKADPAIASGPLIASINDILSFMIYFGIATTFISYLL